MATNKTFRDFLNDEQYLTYLQYGSVAWTLSSLLGMVSNIINIRTFIAMGLKDGVTVSFLALSLFDLAYVVISLCLGIAVGIHIIEVTSKIHFQIQVYGVTVFLTNLMILINVTNKLATTFLAVARCMCVAKPLHFKNSFTRKRTIIIFTAFAIFAMGIYAPVLANMGMVPVKDRRTNRTQMKLWLSKDREAIKDVVWLLIETLMPFVTEIIITVCIFVMAGSLRSASKFRQASTLSSSNVFPKEQQIETSNDDTGNVSDSPANISNKLTGKDLRVVHQVILISSVYNICNIPKILISVVGMLEPQYTIGGWYNNLYLSINGVEKYFGIFNASVNTIIYYMYNSKFRTKLHELVGW